MMNSRAVLLGMIVGAVLQIAMVLAGHSNPAVANLFAVGGMAFSFVAGLAVAIFSRRTTSSAASLAAGGAIAGGACALIGIFVSYMLGDVPATLLALGTASSVVTGSIGGALGKFVIRGGSLPDARTR
jgi:peptidoglycan/LPS O-acetylase OafA/YrhL